MDSHNIDAKRVFASYSVTIMLCISPKSWSKYTTQYVDSKPWALLLVCENRLNNPAYRADLKDESVIS